MITGQRQIFTGADVSLFHIASRTYGDALMAVYIALANGMTDYMITGSVSLVIPPKPLGNNGGNPPQ